MSTVNIRVDEQHGQDRFDFNKNIFEVLGSCSKFHVCVLIRSNVYLCN